MMMSLNQHSGVREREQCCRCRTWGLNFTAFDVQKAMRFSCMYNILAGVNIYLKLSLKPKHRICKPEDSYSFVEAAVSTSVTTNMAAS